MRSRGRMIMTGRNHLLRLRKEEAATGKGVEVGVLFSFEPAVEVGFEVLEAELLLLLEVEVIRVVGDDEALELVFVVEVVDALLDVEDLLDVDVLDVDVDVVVDVVEQEEEEGVEVSLVLLCDVEDALLELSVAELDADVFEDVASVCDESEVVGVGESLELVSVVIGVEYEEGSVGETILLDDVVCVTSEAEVCVSN